MRARLFASATVACLLPLPHLAFAQDAPPKDPPPETSPPAEASPPATDPPTEPTPNVIDPTPPLSLLPTPSDALIDPRMARSWGAAPSRWFAATTVDVGFVYGRPRLSLGYGKPFTQWFGIDLNPVANSGGVGAYGGLRLELPFVDVRVGTRYWFAFNTSYLPPQPSFDRLTLERELGAAARLIVHEAELDSSLPAGPGNILLRASVSYVTNVPDGRFAYDPSLRVIVNPPLVWRARAGYALRLGKYSQHSIGLVADILDVPKRDDSRTIRVGPVLRIVLSRRVDVRGSFVTTVVSPDKIGLAGGDFTELGVRYRWATEP